MWIVLAGVIFTGLLLTNAGIFYAVMGGRIRFKDCFRLTVTASALNKFFFTGSGYLAASYFFKDKDLPFTRILAAFIVMEFFTIVPWICMGVYFGAGVALNLPWIIAPLAGLLFWFYWNKRQKIKEFSVDLFQGFRGAGKNMAVILLLTSAGCCLFFVYYYFIFIFFKFLPGWLKILKIISLSFSAGYLSPAPAGLGFKDAGLVLLLSNSGMGLSPSIWFAAVDRILTMFILAVLACLFGFKFIREQFCFRFTRKNK